MKIVRSSSRLRAKKLSQSQIDAPSKNPVTISSSNSSFTMNLRPRKSVNHIAQPSIELINKSKRNKRTSSKRPINNRTRKTKPVENNTTRTLEANSNAESPSSPTPSFTTSFNYSGHDFLHDIVHVQNLKSQLKKATVKFDKACRQLVMLDQHMGDLQNSYTNSLDNDRKTFKIVYRMQLATLEGTHNAYIEYIERQVEKIKKLKQMIFNDNIEELAVLNYNNNHIPGQTTRTSNQTGNQI